MHIERSFAFGKYTIQIIHDEEAVSPAEDSDADGVFCVSAMTSDWTPYNPLRVWSHDIPEDRAEFEDAYAEDYWAFRLRAHISHGVHLSLSESGQLRDEFDTEFAGWVLVRRTTQWNTEVVARKAAEKLLQEWQDFLDGKAYAYRVLDEYDKEIASCWNYFGDPETSGCISAAQLAALSHHEAAAVAARAKSNDLASDPKGDCDGPHSVIEPDPWDMLASCRDYVSDAQVGMIIRDRNEVTEFLARIDAALAAQKEDQ